LKPLNIKVNVVEPGVVKTNLYRSVQDFSFEQYPVEYQAKFKKWNDYRVKNYDKVGYLPELDAKIIYKAVNSKSTKLKYPSDFMGKSLLFLRSLLGLSVFQKIINKMSIG
jgi:NAD(P)-dependent dehydrogenase (short-subunit alcohol dehydrogenase family)